MNTNTNTRTHENSLALRERYITETPRAVESSSIVWQPKPKPKQQTHTQIQTLKITKIAPWLCIILTNCLTRTTHRMSGTIRSHRIRQHLGCRERHCTKGKVKHSTAFAGLREEHESDEEDCGTDFTDHSHRKAPVDWFDLIWFDLIWFDLIWFDLIVEMRRSDANLRARSNRK